jgi:hypothetical protein
MSLRLHSIDVFVRMLPPNRMDFDIGKQDSGPNSKPPPPRRPNALLLVRLQLQVNGRLVTGCSGDRPSYGWLDKRPDKSSDEKLHALLDLVELARGTWLEEGHEFTSPFELWQRCQARVSEAGQASGHEDLSASYASALFERAMIDAFCKARGRSFFQTLRDDALGFDAGSAHETLKGMRLTDTLPAAPPRRLFIRHTVGLGDPLVDADIAPANRVHDGEPETLKAYADRDGLRFFKVKISGDADRDLARMRRIWNEVLVGREEPAVTLDGNEAYTDIDAFAAFVDRFAKEAPALFEHTLFIEQPLTRALTLDESTRTMVERIARRKPLVIDEADGSLQAYSTALKIGYSGTSHKNCKGVFKSLLNHMLCHRHEATTDRQAFMSAEDLSNMPMVPLHQDFSVVSALGIGHCERNGHHYGFGLSHLTPREKEQVAAAHPNLYVRRGDEWFLNIVDGAVDVTSILVRSGLGGNLEPDWDALTPLEEWRA